MDKPQNKQVDEFAKLSWGERIAYGAGDLAQNLIFGTIGSMLLFYLTTVLESQQPWEPRFFWLFAGSMFFGILGLERLSIRVTLSTAANISHF